MTEIDIWKKSNTGRHNLLEYKNVLLAVNSPTVIRLIWHKNHKEIVMDFNTDQYEFGSACSKENYQTIIEKKYKHKKVGF